MSVKLYGAVPVRWILFATLCYLARGSFASSEILFYCGSTRGSSDVPVLCTCLHTTLGTTLSTTCKHQMPGRGLELYVSDPPLPRDQEYRCNFEFSKICSRSVSSLMHINISLRLLSNCASTCASCLLVPTLGLWTTMWFFTPLKVYLPFRYIWIAAQPDRKSQRAMICLGKRCDQ